MKLLSLAGLRGVGVAIIGAGPPSRPLVGRGVTGHNGMEKSSTLEGRRLLDPSGVP